MTLTMGDPAHDEDRQTTFSQVNRTKLSDVADLGEHDDML